jgi:hypothetical protein
VSKNMSYTLTSFAGGGPWSDISAGPVAQRLEQATHNRSVAGSLNSDNPNSYPITTTDVFLLRAAECAALAAGFALYRRALTPTEIQRAVTEALAQLQGDQP